MLPSMGWDSYHGNGTQYLHVAYVWYSRLMDFGKLLFGLVFFRATRTGLENMKRHCWSTGQDEGREPPLQARRPFGKRIHNAKGWRMNEGWELIANSTGKMWRKDCGEKVQRLESLHMDIHEFYMVITVSHTSYHMHSNRLDWYDARNDGEYSISFTLS